MHPALTRLTAPGHLTLGIEFPLDHDWTPAGEAKRLADARPFGVPDFRQQMTHARQIDQLGFAGLWLRDVPLYDPAFGDAAQVFEPFTALGYLAAATERIVLGTAGIVLPLRDPLLTAKAASSVDVLSGGRFILGLASGDRPVEYPVLNQAFDTRGERLRSGIDVMRRAWNASPPTVLNAAGQPTPLDLLPKPLHGPVPLLTAGRAQQSLSYLGEQLDALFYYPLPLTQTALQVREWRRISEPHGFKPYVTAFHLDLAEDPDTPFIPHKFGARLGRHALLDYLRGMQETGVNHLALHLRRNVRPLSDTLNELAETVLPHFPTPT